MNVHLAAYHRAIENHRQAITEQGRKLARVEASTAWTSYVESQPKRSIPADSRAYLADRSGFGPTVDAGEMQPGNVTSSAVVVAWDGSDEVKGSAEFPAPPPTRDEVKVDDVVETFQVRGESGGWVDYSSIKGHEVREAINLVRRNPGRFRIVRRGMDSRTVMV